MNAVQFRNAGFRYPHASGWAFEHLNLEIAQNALTLVIGESGSGKSTALRAINGLVPHSTSGTLSGSVVTLGSDTRTHRPVDFAGHVGFVAQDPESQTVRAVVAHDVAFTLECKGTQASEMEQRVKNALECCQLEHLAHRKVSTLSGGERQRTVIAGTLAAGCELLVLDEPTSQLDPANAQLVLQALTHAIQQTGVTVVLAEHRLDLAAPLADHAVQLHQGQVLANGDTRTLLRDYAGAPPVVTLGRNLGWDPLPLSVSEAQCRQLQFGPRVSAPADAPSGELLLDAQDVSVAFGSVTALDHISVRLHEGEVVALVGHNGSGKTTLLRALAQLIEPTSGAIHSERAAFVPQDPNMLLYARSVREEVATTLRLLGQKPDERVDAWLDALGLTLFAAHHPRALSGGQRQRVAIAAVAVGSARVLLLDEPTRGMDYTSRKALERAIQTHTSNGGAVLIATHDMELVARAAHQVLHLEKGKTVGFGDPFNTLSHTDFAQQMLQLTGSHLTVDEVLNSQKLVTA